MMRFQTDFPPSRRERSRLPREQGDGASGLLALGIILGLVFPIGGAVVAVVLFAKNQIGPGLAVLVTCAIGVLLFLSLSFGGG